MSSMLGDGAVTGTGTAAVGRVVGAEAAAAAVGAALPASISATLACNSASFCLSSTSRCNAYGGKRAPSVPNSPPQDAHRRPLPPNLHLALERRESRLCGGRLGVLGSRCAARRSVDGICNPITAGGNGDGGGRGGSRGRGSCRGGWRLSLAHAWLSRPAHLHAARTRAAVV